MVPRYIAPSFNLVRCRASHVPVRKSKTPGMRTKFISFRPCADAEYSASPIAVVTLCCVIGKYPTHAPAHHIKKPPRHRLSARLLTCEVGVHMQYQVKVPSRSMASQNQSPHEHTSKHASRPSSVAWWQHCSSVQRLSRVKDVRPGLVGQPHQVTNKRTGKRHIDLLVTIKRRNHHANTAMEVAVVRVTPNLLKRFSAKACCDSVRFSETGSRVIRIPAYISRPPRNFTGKCSFNCLPNKSHLAFSLTDRMPCTGQRQPSQVLRS